VPGYLAPVRRNLSTSSGAGTVTEPWASVEDVAKHLGVAKDSVYRWIDHRGLPAHKIGRLWKFKLSEVDEWVRAGVVDDSDANSKGDR
jgi:excisionase family DNA binding protein